jgi:hypothetical protein
LQADAAAALGAAFGATVVVAAGAFVVGAGVVAGAVGAFCAGVGASWAEAPIENIMSAATDAPKPQAVLFVTAVISHGSCLPRYSIGNTDKTRRCDELLFTTSSKTALFRPRQRGKIVRTELQQRRQALDYMRLVKRPALLSTVIDRKLLWRCG